MVVVVVPHGVHRYCAPPGNAMVDQVRAVAADEGSGVVVVSAQVESELSGLDLADRRAFLEELGVSNPDSVGFSALVGPAQRGWGGKQAAFGDNNAA